jgi:predicted ATPase
MLVLVDNCEHLLDPVAAVAETILAQCPNAAILATSREPLEVQGERVIRVRSLPVPQAGATTDHLADFDAARLFLDRAEATGANLTLGPADGPAIAEICRRLDGIPLAIELAAARVVALAPGEIAAHLDERFRLLTGGRRAALERQHTLRATIDWSYATLNERDKAVFNRLGIFPASFDASAARAVAATGGVEPWDVLDALTSLVTKSMLNADRSGTGPTRYQMLESLRHYGRERLDAGGDADEARRRHAHHYAAAAVEVGSGQRGPDEALWRRRLNADLENFRAALTWALDSEFEEDGELAVVILGELGVGAVGWTVSSFAAEDYERAVDVARRGAPRYVSLVIAGAAVNAYYRGDFRRGRELSREAIQAVRESPYPGSVLSMDFVFVNPDALAEELSAALEVLDDIGADIWEYAQVRAAAAGMAAVFGNVDLAQQQAAVALEMSRRLGSQWLLAPALYALGLASWQSDPIAARTALEEHVQIARSLGYDPALARALALLAQLQARHDGDHAAAVAALREAIEGAHVNADQPATAVCLARGAVVMAAHGELETAAVFWGAVAHGVFARLTVLQANEIPDYNEFVTTLRSQLGDDRYTAATARGAAMTYEQVTPYALAAAEHL